MTGPQGQGLQQVAGQSLPWRSALLVYSCRDVLGPMTGASGLRNEELPSAFWDALPKTADHPDQLALEALRAESTPDEQAETHKVPSLTPRH